jgi:hypothetical protein
VLDRRREFLAYIVGPVRGPGDRLIGAVGSPHPTLVGCRGSFLGGSGLEV